MRDPTQWPSEHELNDKTHRTWIKNVMNAVGIVSSKSTYASRKTGAQQAEILGVPKVEVSGPS